MERNLRKHNLRQPIKSSLLHTQDLSLAAETIWLADASYAYASYAPWGASLNLSSPPSFSLIFYVYYCINYHSSSMGEHARAWSNKGSMLEHARAWASMLGRGRAFSGMGEHAREWAKMLHSLWLLIFEFSDLSYLLYTFLLSCSYNIN